MRLLLGLAIGAFLGWYAGRDYEWRHGECTCDDDDVMAAVQPSEPWPPVQTQWPPPQLDTYNEAYTRAVIRGTRPFIASNGATDVAVTPPYDTTDPVGGM